MISYKQFLCTMECLQIDLLTLYTEHCLTKIIIIMTYSNLKLYMHVCVHVCVVGCNRKGTLHGKVMISPSFSFIISMADNSVLDPDPTVK